MDSAESFPGICPVPGHHQCHLQFVGIVSLGKVWHRQAGYHWPDPKPGFSHLTFRPTLRNLSGPSRKFKDGRIDSETGCFRSLSSPKRGTNEMSNYALLIDFFVSHSSADSRRQSWSQEVKLAHRVLCSPLKFAVPLLLLNLGSQVQTSTSA